MRRMIVGISGATGAIYGIRTLQLLQKIEDIEVHLVMTPAARLTIAAETDFSLPEVRKLADVVHDIRDVGATISSGSFRTLGMIVAPCSMRTLSAIVHSAAGNLLVRAADVVLKERRRLVLLPRETPLHLGHCRLLTSACELGAILVPPVPAFYNRPKTIDDIVNHTVGRALDLFDLDTDEVQRWGGLRAALGQKDLNVDE